MRLRSPAGLAAPLFVLAALAPSAAHAAPPPAGAYDCVIGSSQILFGTLTVEGSAYVHRGSAGDIKAGRRARIDATGARSTPIRLKGGDLGGTRGRWYRSTSGTVEIALRNRRDDFESIYCTARP